MSEPQSELTSTDKSLQLPPSIEAVRADLHRYCTRMTGSVFDGEDIVQDTLLTAQRELAGLRAVPPLRPWLFRIAHNRAIDHLRRSKRRQVGSPEEMDSVPSERAIAPDMTAIRHDHVVSAFGIFSEIPPIQRSCVILKEVFDYSMDDIAMMLELTVPSVKSALLRGRGNLSALAAGAKIATPSAILSSMVVHYADLFNRRDWDGLRALLVEDVRLDLVSRLQRHGRGDVGNYFNNYASIHGWRVEMAWLEQQPVLTFYRAAVSVLPDYVMSLTWRGTQVSGIRDYRYVPYLLQEVTSASWTAVMESRISD